MSWKNLVAGGFVKFSVFMELLLAVTWCQMIFAGSSIKLLCLDWFWGPVCILFYDRLGWSPRELFF